MINKRPRQPHVRGFTLIELLIVVLIIGILAAIALPQYRKSVDKTIASRELSMLRAIKNAQELYYLTHNAYSDNYEDLDISIPSKNPPYSCNSGGHMTQCINGNNAMYSLLSNAGAVWATIPNSASPWLRLGIEMDKHAGNSFVKHGVIMCVVPNAATNKRGVGVCDSLGGKAYHTSTSDHYYVLE
jgi:prepilin-type N-terminal cleavage/methylation domain-containing protein